MQNYLAADSDLTNQEKKDAFKIRSRMIDIKADMKNIYLNVTCVIK